MHTKLPSVDEQSENSDLIDLSSIYDAPVISAQAIVSRAQDCRQILKETHSELNRLKARLASLEKTLKADIIAFQNEKQKQAAFAPARLTLLDQDDTSPHSEMTERPSLPSRSKIASQPRLGQGTAHQHQHQHQNQAGPETVLAPKPSQSSSPSIHIPRNIHGQRIDPFYQTTALERNRILQFGLCFNHFLRQDCRFGTDCHFLHSLSPSKGGLPDGKLSPRDLQIFAQVTRRIVCKTGTSCQDKKCCYGHRCTVEERWGNSVRNNRNQQCQLRQKCFFPPEMHLVDIRIVPADEV